MTTTSSSIFKYRLLGSTGVKVSEICLGAMTFSVSGKGAWGLPSADQDESFKMLNYFAEKGGNFIDTANAYHESEEVVGKWLSTKKRDDFVIATKVGAPTGGVNKGGLSRRHIMNQVEESLRKLQTNYIDLYQAHAMDLSTPIEDILKSFDDLVRSGKVRYIGISNWTGAELQKAISISKYQGLEKVICLQPQYNLLCRSTEWDLIPLCIQENIAVIPWSPLAGGWLSGKHGKEKPNEGSRVEWAEKVGWKPTGFSSKSGQENTWKILDTVATIAKENSMTDAQVALRWLIQKPGVTAPIVGAKTLEQLKGNLDAALKELSVDQMKKLDEVSAIEVPYPWGFLRL